MDIMDRWMERYIVFLKNIEKELTQMLFDLAFSDML